MWRRQLLSLLASPAFAAKPLAPVYLNHFYATVDPATYQAIESSDFLHTRFAPFEKRTTVRNDSTYSGLYFYGAQTYFEFFAANTGDRKPGDAGLALGLETADGAESLREQWQTLSPSLVTTVTRQLNGKPLDWFRMASFEESRANSAVEGFRLFAMQYDPQFVPRWLEQPNASPTLLREAVLAAYCTRLQLDAIRKNSLLENVVALEIGGPEANLRRRAAQLTAAGWKQTKTAGALVLAGPQAEVTLRFAAKIEGVRRATFSLKQGLAHTESIGNSKLTFSRDRRAVWSFV